MTTEPDLQQLLHWHEQMWTIRYFEENAINSYRKGLFTGSTHPCICQEAIAVIARRVPDLDVAGTDLLDRAGNAHGRLGVATHSVPQHRPLLLAHCRSIAYGCT